MGIKIITRFVFLVETARIVEIFHQFDDTETYSYSLNEQGILSQEFTLFPKDQVVVQLRERRRLYGIRLDPVTSGLDVFVFGKAQFSFVGDKNEAPQIAYERMHLNNSSSLFAFKNLTEELTSVSFELVGSDGFSVRHLEIYAFPEQCGHPEIPKNGAVVWQSGSPTATYSCHSRYALHSANETRICQRGRWSGSEPVCKPFRSLLVN
jgi:Sushi repeat (SCR repeat)